MRAVAAAALVVLVLGVGGAAYANADPIVTAVLSPTQALLGGVLASRTLPEPASLSLFGTGLFGSAFLLRRRRRTKA
jgi:hypothetical protein